LNPVVEVIKVIRTRLERRGEGSKDNPNRIVTQYWTLEGEFLCEHDPLTASGVSYVPAQDSQDSQDS